MADLGAITNDVSTVDELAVSLAAAVVVTAVVDVVGVMVVLALGLLGDCRLGLVRANGCSLLMLAANLTDLGFFAAGGLVFVDSLEMAIIVAWVVGNWLN